MIRLKRYIQSVSIGVNSLFKTLKPVNYLCMNIGLFFVCSWYRYPLVLVTQHTLSNANTFVSIDIKVISKHCRMSSNFVTHITTTVQNIPYLILPTPTVHSNTEYATFHLTFINSSRELGFPDGGLSDFHQAPRYRYYDIRKSSDIFLCNLEHGI